MINLTRFKMQDIKGFNPRAIVVDFKITMLENFMDASKDIVTMKNGGGVVCIAGVNHLRTGVAEVWLIPSDDIDHCKLAFYKAVRKLVDFVIKEMGIHRVELAIDCAWEGGAKWALSLGFKFESIARAYDFNRRDHAIYTRIT